MTLRKAGNRPTMILDWIFDNSNNFWGIWGLVSVSEWTQLSLIKASKADRDNVGVWRWGAFPITRYWEAKNYICVV